MDKLLDLLVYNPRERFGIAQNGFSVWKLDEEFTVDPSTFKSKGKATPFEGATLYGKCVATIC